MSNKFMENQVCLILNAFTGNEEQRHSVKYFYEKNQGCLFSTTRNSIK